MSVRIYDVAHLSEILAQDGELFEGIGYSGILYGTHHQVGHHREQLLLANMKIIIIKTHKKESTKQYMYFRQNFSLFLFCLVSLGRG